MLLGPPKLRCLDRPVAVSLDELVPATHFYRHLDATLDLSFVRAWAKDCYAERGRPSIDPAALDTDTWTAVGMMSEIP